MKYIQTLLIACLLFTLVACNGSTISNPAPTEVEKSVMVDTCKVLIRQM